MPDFDKKEPPVPSDPNQLRDLFGIVSRGKYMWEATFDAIRDPVMIINQEFRIQRANVAAADRSGSPIQQIIGKRCYEVFARRDAPCPGCPLPQTVKMERPNSVEIGSLIAKGAGGDFQVNSYPIHRLEGSLEGSGEGSGGYQVVHHYRDITEERRLQRQLIQSEKMAAIGMLAGGVAHEINNPLAGILAFTQLLKKELPPGGGLLSDLGEIEEAARRCKKIVEDLLLFARPHQEGDKTPFSLEEAVQKILPLARLNLRHLNVMMVTDYGPGLPRVRGNVARIQQVFLNLIQNAAQATARTGGLKGGGMGGVVTLRMRASEDQTQLATEVIDNGCGIKREDLPRIFDPFFSTKEKNEGTGLGLSICYSIISEHRGKIEVESEEGRGSLFRVLLPSEGGT